MTDAPEPANTPEAQLALGLSLARSGQHAEAIAELMRYFAMGAGDPAAYDALAQSALHCPNSLPGRLQGSITLARKDKAAMAGRGTAALADPLPQDSKSQVIAFTLFGSDPRYLRGALHNVLAARDHYPAWSCRFYVDSSVDSAFLDVLAGEGAEIVMDESGDTDFRYRLCRRFLVADDADVGRFLVRDCDSVVGPREAAAVAAWIESGKHFHAMRDWWTHTDLMFAGMWGGFAGILPSMAEAIAEYRRMTPDGPNWDQRFLGWHVWPLVRHDILVHDRLFSAHATQPFPTPTPPGLEHVGQNEFVASRAAQAQLLAPFVARVPALGLNFRAAQ
jgi:hypothetical protein